MERREICWEKRKVEEESLKKYLDSKDARLSEDGLVDFLGIGLAVHDLVSHTRASQLANPRVDAL